MIPFDPSIEILIGTRTNHRNSNQKPNKSSESQSESGQSIHRAVTARFVHGVKEQKNWRIYVGLGKIYISHSNARALC